MGYLKRFSVFFSLSFPFPSSPPPAPPSSFLDIHDFFFNFILLIILLQLSQFFPFSPYSPHSLRQSPHHCSCPWVMHISSLATPFPTLYFISPWLCCNYLFVLLNSLTSSPIPPPPSHLATIQMLSVSVILSQCFLFA